MKKRVIKNMVDVLIQTYGFEDEKSIQMATVYENYLNNRITFIESCKIFNELSN